MAQDTFVQPPEHRIDTNVRQVLLLLVASTVNLAPKVNAAQMVSTRSLVQPELTHQVSAQPVFHAQQTKSATLSLTSIVLKVSTMNLLLSFVQNAQLATTAETILRQLAPLENTCLSKGLLSALNAQLTPGAQIQKCLHILNVLTTSNGQPPAQLLAQLVKRTTSAL